MSTDPFASYDAAYVLGALSPQDRQEYEQHLNECADCAAAVRDLAGLPGLLTKVPADLVSETRPPDPPETLLPRLLGAVRRQRRVRWSAIGASLTAAAACLVLVLFLALRPDPGDQPVAVPTATMSPVDSAPVWATVGLEQVAWGTRVDMHCMYERKVGFAGVYTLVAIDDGGDVEHLASWTVRPGKDAKLQAATSWKVDDIAAIEVRTSEGKSVLRLRP